MPEMKPCVKSINNVSLDFFLCERTHDCVVDKNNGQTCTYHIAGQQNAIVLAAVRENCWKKGYKLAPIEHLIVRLQEADWPVTILGKGRGRLLSMRRITNNCRFEPLEIRHTLAYDYAARASAQDSCPAFNILSNIVEKNLPFEPKPNLISQMGTCEHALQLNEPTGHEHDFVHRSILTDIKLTPVPRQKYCECALEAKITATGEKITPTQTGGEMNGQKNMSHFIIRGHSDALLKVVDNFGNVEGLAAIDCKHRQYNSMKEIQSFVRQTLIYAIAAAQIANIEPKYYLLVTVRSPFGEMEGHARKQKPVITMIPNEPTNLELLGLKAYLKRSLQRQERILASTISFAREKGKQEKLKAGGCFRRGDGHQICFKKEVCDYLASAVKESQQPLGTILAQNNYVPAQYELCKKYRR